MCQPKKWWVGLLPLALLWLLANWVSTPKIEAELGGCAAAAIKGLPVENGAVEVLGRDVLVHGRIFSAATGEKAAQAAAGCGNGARGGVTDATVLVAEAKPYAWTATRDGAKMALSGNVPDPQTRASLNAAARKAFDGADVTDTMTYARGAPACFAAAAAFAFKELAAFGKGSVGLSGDAIAVAGEAQDLAGYDSAQAALKSAPAGCAVKGAEAILPPEIKNYSWSATRSGNAVTLEGYVPGAEVRKQIVDAAKAALPDAAVTDAMRVARGAPASLAAGAAFGLSQLARLSEGKAVLSGESLSLSGDAASPAQFAELGAAAKAAPAGIAFAAPAVRPAEARPFSWSAARSEGAVTLQGFAPSPGAQARLAAAAKAAFPALTVIDKTAIARGAPGGVEAAAAFALAQLAGLSSGAAGFTDTAFSVSGDAPSPQAYAAAMDSLKLLPGGFALAGAAVRAPLAESFSWTVERGDGTATLSGYAPSPGAKDRIAELARQALPGVAVTDTTLVARGAPVGIEGAVAYALGMAAKLSSGAVTVRDTDISVAGVAASSAAYLAAIPAAGQAPDGFAAVSNIMAPMAAAQLWSAKRDGATATLSGYAASPEQAAALAEAARAALPGVAVDDRMEIARGTNGDLEAAAAYGLGELARLSGGAVSVTGRDVSIAGEAATPGAYASVLGAASRITSSYALATLDVRAPAVTPYVWSAVKDGGAVFLSGFAPSLSARERVLAAAKAALPEAQITDLTQIARGAPGGFEAMAANGFSLLARLSAGQVNVTDQNLTAAGDAPTQAAAEAARAALRQMPPGYAILSEVIRAPKPPPKAEPAPPPPKAEPAPPPKAEPAPLPPKAEESLAAPAESYPFEAVKSEGTLLLTGAFPDEKAHDEIIDTATRRFFAEKVIDQLALAPGAPKNFVAAVSVALEQLSRLAAGKVTIAGASVEVSGEARFAQAAEDIAASAKSLLPPGFVGSAAVSVQQVQPEVSAVNCQEYLSNILELGAIRFATGSAEIKSESFGLLDALAQTAARCGNAKIEVAGHTDSLGPADLNQELSARRAASVVAYLARAGIPIGQLSPAGFGPSRPIAPNDTEEGRAKNRRIEFIVK